MGTAARRRIWFVLVPLLLLAASGALVFFVARTWLAAEEPQDAVALVSIALPGEASLLAWSPDGRYLAAGSGYTDGQWVQGLGKLFVVDVAGQAVLRTVDTNEGVDGLAFSPDGKWLAITTRRGIQQPPESAELIVFTVPDFAVKFKGQSERRPWEHHERGFPGGFADIAWAPDGKALYAIDGGQAVDAKIRRWNAPHFDEGPAFRVKEDTGDNMTIAVAPNGRTLATVAESYGGILRLFDVDKGAEVVTVNVPKGFYRAAFTADGKAVGVFAGIEAMLAMELLFGKDKTDDKQPRDLTWWDVTTGKPASPSDRRFAVPPAAQANSRYYAVSPDSRMWAHTLMFLRPDDMNNRYIVLTRTGTAKTWSWRIGAVGTVNLPVLAFSPDGTRLAGTLKTPAGWTIALWAVP
jgi:WD40 repeat protein